MPKPVYLHLVLDDTDDETIGAVIQALRASGLRSHHAWLVADGEQPDLGQVAHDAYNSFMNASPAVWDELPAATRNAWRFAVDTALAADYKAGLSIDEETAGE